MYRIPVDSAKAAVLCYRYQKPKLSMATAPLPTSLPLKVVQGGAYVVRYELMIMGYHGPM